MKNECKILNILGDTQEYPNLAKISRKKGVLHDILLFSLPYGSESLAPISFDPNITLYKVVVAVVAVVVVVVGIVVVVVVDVVIHH